MIAICLKEKRVGHLTTHNQPTSKSTNQPNNKLQPFINRETYMRNILTRVDDFFPLEPPVHCQIIIKLAE